MNRTSFSFCVTRVIFIMVALIGTVYAGPGDLDLTFGNGSGKVITSFPTGTDAYAYDAVIDGLSGKMTVAGEVINQPQGTRHIALARYNSDGRLDSTFGVGGRVDVSFGYLTIQANAIARQADGKLVVAGSLYNQGIWSFAIARFNTNGSIDGSFSSDGLRTLTWGGDVAVATDVAIQSDGKILVAGHISDNQDNSDFGVVRLNTNGGTDVQFGYFGTAKIDFLGSSDYPYGMAIQNDGKIVVCGYANNVSPGNQRWAIARLNSDGGLDTSFGSGGKLTYDWSFTADYAMSVAIQTDGKIVVSGMVNGITNFGLARFSSTGVIDFAFVNDFPNNDKEQSFSVRVATNGRIISGGFARNVSNTTAVFALSCHNANGTLDNSFGTSGRVTTDMGPDWDEIDKVLVQKDGKIVAVGFSYDANQKSRFALARYLGCGL